VTPSVSECITWHVEEEGNFKPFCFFSFKERKERKKQSFASEKTEFE
jgi:hypothetical protein